jgi:hypothetical protein
MGKQSLKKKIYNYDQVKTWLLRKKQVDAEIVAGEGGESFAVYFYPTKGAKSIDFKWLTANVAQLLDLDKPYSSISSIRLEKYRTKTALRIGWTA